MIITVIWKATDMADMEAILKGHDPALHAGIDKPIDADPFSPSPAGVA
jgi:hypothetical protein